MATPLISTALGRDSKDSDFTTVCRYCWRKSKLSTTYCDQRSSKTEYVCPYTDCRSVIVELRRAKGEWSGREHLRPYRSEDGRWDVWSSTKLSWKLAGSHTPPIEIVAAVPLSREPSALA